MHMPTSYEATYVISRGGKPTAEQITTFVVSDNNQFTLTDETTGTHGLASMTGFKRIETTQFSFQHGSIIDIEHQMQQKVAFSKKKYHFKTQADRINGKAKKTFEIKSDIKPLSAHMLPVWLSSAVCQGQKSIDLEVLKSNKTKTYRFKIIDEDANFFRVERQYPPGSERSTAIWLDKSKQCFPTKTLHQKKGDPVVETKLTQLKR